MLTRYPFQFTSPVLAALFALAAVWAPALAQSGAPVAPSKLTAAATSSTAVKLTWRDNSNNEAGFDIGLRTPGGNWASRTPGAAKNATSFTVSNLTPGQTYEFQVTAYNSAGWSSPAKAKVTVPCPTPSLKSSKSGTSKLKLSWTDTCKYESGYTVVLNVNGTVTTYQYSANTTSATLALPASAIPSNALPASITVKTQVYALPSSAIPSNLKFQTSDNAITGGAAGSNVTTLKFP